MQTSLTNGGRMVKQGRTYDYECSRTSWRLKSAVEILKTVGVVATFPSHADECMLSEAQRFNRLATWSYSCSCGIGHDPAPTWPEWVTDETFNLAYALADTAQTARGAHNRRLALA